MEGRAVWFTWEDHRRSRELAAAVGARLVVLTREASGVLGKAARYLTLSLRTLAALAGTRPRLVFSQNPSIVLAALLGAVKGLFRFTLVVDRHSSFKLDTLASRNPKFLIFHRLSRYTVRRADLTIVTNDHLRELVERWGGRGFVLPDRLPRLEEGERRPLAGKKNIVFVCRFDADEPVLEVLEAAGRLEPGWVVHVTGNPSRFAQQEELRARAPENVRFTGFLPEKDYQSLLLSADLVMVLTRLEHLLNCGSYESVSLGRPMVLSDTATIRGYFSKGAVYTALTPAAIAAAIRVGIAEQPRLTEEVVRLREELTADGERRLALLEERIRAVGRRG